MTLKNLLYTGLLATTSLLPISGCTTEVHHHHFYTIEKELKPYETQARELLGKMGVKRSDHNYQKSLEELRTSMERNGNREFIEGIVRDFPNPKIGKGIDLEILPNEPDVKIFEWNDFPENPHQR